MTKGAGAAPRATVIVPSYDHENFVAQAVESALGQTASAIEVLVIDDGSRDGSRERLAAIARRGDPRLRVLHQENRGLSRTLNRGLAEARGAWVKFLPSDDALEPFCLERQLAAVDAQPSLGVVFSLPTVVDAAGEPLADPAPQAWFDVCADEPAELLFALVERNPLSAPGALFARDLALAAGGFDPSLAVAQDYDLWLRLLARAPGRLLRERLVRVRWHGRNQSARATAATEAERAYALVQALARAGLERWVEWTRRARGGDDRSARLELARALLRSGLAEARPFARRLLVEARALGADLPADPLVDDLVATAPELARPGPWGGIAEGGIAEARSAARPGGPEEAAGVAPPPAGASSADRGANGAPPVAPPDAAAGRNAAGFPARERGLRGLAPALRGALRRALRRVLVRRASAPPPAAALPAAPLPGPRRGHWLVLAVVPLDDSGGGQRSAQLARALARAGERVTYVARFPRAESVDLGIAELPPAPAVLPWDLARLRRLVREEDERLRLLVEVPEAAAVGLAREASERGARVLYDKVDAWERCAFAPWYSRADEEALIAGADDLIGTSRPIVRSLATARRPVHYLPNAVDEGVFRPLPPGAPRPDDLPEAPVTLVYAGALWGEWFDWECLTEVARARPAWSIVLLGDPPPAVPALPPSVRLLGLKRQRDLPPYLAAATACLIPFRRMPLTAAVSPLKLFEYLAMRRPVVASHLEELADAPYVFFADGAAEVVAAVERAAATPVPEAAIAAFVERHTWAARAASLVALTARPSAVVIVLRHGAREPLHACLDALLAARGEQTYRVAVVDDGTEGPEDETLAAREEAGEILLLRSALRGAGAARNLALRATRSEIVAFVAPDQRVSGPGWLDEAVRLLADDRRVGAVGRFAAPAAARAGAARAGVDGSGRAEAEPDGARAEVAALSVDGLVVPRSVLARIGGFDERRDPEGCGGRDLSARIRAAGWVLVCCSGLGVAAAPASALGRGPAAGQARAAEAARAGLRRPSNPV